jgi:hypothetical protein
MTIYYYCDKSYLTNIGITGEDASGKYKNFHFAGIYIIKKQATNE